MSKQPTLQTLHHVAIVVPKLEQGIATFQNCFRNKPGDIKMLPEHGVRLTWLELKNCKMELMEPYGENSPLISFLKRNPSGGIHHLCFEVDDLAATHNYLSHQGFRCSMPRPGDTGLPVTFLHPKDFLHSLIELQQLT